MNDFDYLSVLISIVLGLGITNLLTGLAVLVRRRGALVLYWPLPVWIVTLFLIHVQTWWAMFGLREVRVWNFPAFLTVLMQPVLLFLMSALILPEAGDGSERVDLRAAYFRESRWFFVTLILGLCVSLSKDLVLTGKLPHPANLAAHLIFIAVAAVGAVSRNDLVHKVLAPLGLLFFSAYIAFLFTTLT